MVTTAKTTTETPADAVTTLTMDYCDICLNSYDNGSNAMVTLLCQHWLCTQCSRHPTILSASGNIKCPFCRTICAEGNFSINATAGESFSFEIEATPILMEIIGGGSIAVESGEAATELATELREALKASPPPTAIVTNNITLRLGGIFDVKISTDGRDLTSTTRWEFSTPIVQGGGLIIRGGKFVVMNGVGSLLEYLATLSSTPSPDAGSLPSTAVASPSSTDGASPTPAADIVPISILNQSHSPSNLNPGGSDDSNEGGFGDTEPPAKRVRRNSEP